MDEAGLQHVDVLEGAVAFRDLIAPRFGPAGGKILIADGDPIVTSDLHRLLDAVNFSHPSARLVATAAVSQKEVVGDGSVTVVILAGGLAERAQQLLADGVQRATIVQGFQRARQTALKSFSTHLQSVRGPADPLARGVTRTALAGEFPSKDRVIDSCLEAAQLIDAARRGYNRRLDLQDIRFSHIPGENGAGPKVELVRGAVLDESPIFYERRSELTDTRIAVIGGGRKAGTGIEERALRREGGSPGKGRKEVRRSASSYEDAKTFREHEKDEVEQLVQSVVDVGASVVFCTMGISDAARSHLKRANVTAFRGITDERAAFIARATGAHVVMHLPDISPDDLGRAGRVRIFERDDRTYVRLEECPTGAAATILLTGALTESVEELERDLRTGIVMALAVIDGGPTVPGGGAIDVTLAHAVRQAARAHPNRSAIAMGAYADALEDVPRALASNSGMDPIDTLAALRAGRDRRVQIDLDRVDVGPPTPEGPRHPERVIRTALEAATDTVVQLVRIDEVLPATRDTDEDTDFDLRPKPGRDA